MHTPASPHTAISVAPAPSSDASFDPRTNGSADWTFAGDDTRTLTHTLHDYPARMIPQVARRVLREFLPARHGHGDADGASGAVGAGEAVGAVGAALVFDPFCGTGTTLVEARLLGLNALGTDLNPLARLIAFGKTHPPNLPAIDAAIAELARPLNVEPWRPAVDPEWLEFWFDPAVIVELGRLAAAIAALRDISVRTFARIALSETVRECSNTRRHEFKLYRYAPRALRSRRERRPAAQSVLLEKLHRNRAGVAAFLAARPAARIGVGQVRIREFNTVTGVPRAERLKGRVDLVLTSPPYGDSRTTVAYGQYSRLSAAWLNLPRAEQTDAELLGGRVRRQDLDSFEAEAARLPCAELRAAIGQIARLDAKRAAQVVAFYSDLWRSTQNVAPLLRPGGTVCYVVGNRRVKGVELPTDSAVRDFFVAASPRFQPLATHFRRIPNKRMPAQNSPSNAVGAVAPTMHGESIVLLRATK